MARSNTKAASVTSSRASAVVAAFLDGVASTDAAAASLFSAKLNMLQSLQSVLKGSSAITEALWASQWKEAVETGLVASGRYKKESVAPTASLLKVAVIGLTNEYEPTKDHTSLHAYVKDTRPILKDDGILEETGKGAKRTPPGAKGDKPEKGAKAEPLSPEAAFKAAAMLLAEGDETDAKILALILTDYADDFYDWANAHIAAKAGQRRRRA